MFGYYSAGLARRHGDENFFMGSHTIFIRRLQDRSKFDGSATFPNTEKQRNSNKHGMFDPECKPW